MENILINNDENEGIYTKDINGEICLHYKLNYANQNILTDSKFKNWLNNEIKKKGKNKYLVMCKNCNLFIYLKDSLGIFYIQCCDKKNFLNLCLYCGSFFKEGSYCCVKNGLKWSFGLLLFNGKYECFKYEDVDTLKYFPFLFHLIFIGTFYTGLFLHRKLTVNNNPYENYTSKGTSISLTATLIGILFIFVQSIVYFFPFIIIYFIYIILILTGFKL